MLKNPIQSVITIKEVMEFLFSKSTEPFQITFISLDKERNKGGDIIKIDKCAVPRFQAYSNTAANSLTTTEFVKAKNPNHLEHNTINLHISENNRIIKVHIDLITEFNNKRVIW